MDVIPPRDPVSGCIPPGRYSTSLAEIQAEFVEPFISQPESVREILWQKLADYLTRWNHAEKKAEEKLLLGLWFAGSFITDRQEPDDIDLTAIYDGAKMSTMEGKPGSRELRKLAGLRHRKAGEHGIEVYPLPWRSIASTLFTEKLTLHDSQYLVKLGALDDFWQRKPPITKDAAPIAPLVKADRGYLEVMF